MKLLLIATVILMLKTLNSSAQNSEMLFVKNTWNEIKKKAEKENKIIFLDCYAIWCAPCKLMERTVFKDEEVAKFYNNNFINAKFDMEKGEGLNLARQYGIYAYPTFLFLSSWGEVVHKALGAMSEKEFLQLGKIANSDKNLSSYKKKIENKQITHEEFKSQISQVSVNLVKLVFS